MSLPESNTSVEDYGNEECNKRSHKKCELGKFSIPLNGQALDEQLAAFQNLCQEYARHYNKRCRKRYYHLGLMALLENDTTTLELRRLLKHGVRTFLLDLVTHKKSELENLLLLLYEAIAEVQKEYLVYNRLVVGLAVQISGDCCRFGRFRNNSIVFVHCNDIITLTTNTAYRHSSYKQICYVINLIYYLSNLKLSDVCILGKDGVSGKVVKLFQKSCAICIINGGHLHSYDYIELPDQCTLTREIHVELFKEDLISAKEIGAHYILLPHIRCQNVVSSLKHYMQLNETTDWKLIATIDFDYVQKHTHDLLSMLKLLDYLLLPELFLGSVETQKYITQDVIPMVRCLKRPVIGLVPIEHCCDFKVYENHQYLWKLDALLIQKSRSARKYPLIATKLLPIRNFKLAMVENALAVKRLVANYPSIVSFIIRTVSSIECQALLLYSKCNEAAIALARMEIYCPVYVILPIEEEPESNEECIIQLARSYQLRRNLYPIMYTRDMNNCNFPPVEYGLDLLRRIGQLETGDFVITLELKKQLEEEIISGIGNDFIIMRAFYLPPQQTANKYRYA